MNDSGLIKEFFISLGFRLDEASLRKFQSAIKETEISVISLGTRMVTTATATFVFFERIAAGMEKSYFASKRLGSTVGEIDDFALSIRNLGGSAESAKQSAESFAIWRKTTLGGDGILTGIMGVKPEHLKDTVATFKDTLHTLGQWQREGGLKEAMAFDYAAQFGIDQNTLQAAKNGDPDGDNMQKLRAMLGLTDEANKKAHEFENSWHTVLYSLSTFGQWMESDLNKPMSEFVTEVQKAIVGLEEFIKVWQTSGLSKALETAGVPKGMANFLGSNPDKALTDVGFLAPDDGNSSLLGRYWTAYKNTTVRNYNRVTGPGHPGIHDNSINQDAAAQYAMSYLINKRGFSRNSAAAAVASIGGESGFDPAAQGDWNEQTQQYDAFGLFQLHPDRQRDFFDVMGKDIQGSTTDEQLDFLAIDLKRKHKNVGDMLDKDKSAYSAGYDFRKYYEGPNDPLGLKAISSGVEANRLSNITINITAPSGDAKAIAHEVSTVIRNVGGATGWQAH